MMIQNSLVFELLRIDKKKGRKEKKPFFYNLVVVKILLLIIEILNENDLMFR